jgi:hypothetical protein
VLLKPKKRLLFGLTTNVCLCGKSCRISPPDDRRWLLREKLPLFEGLVETHKSLFSLGGDTHVKHSYFF